VNRLRTLYFTLGQHWLAGLVLVVALSLRLWNLGGLPFGFHNDEVMNGYVGRYILENGHDLYGNPWPILYFDNFGDYPNVLPMYLSGASTKLFGTTEWAVRFPIALAGALTTIPVYYLALQTTKNKRVAAVTAGLLAILPWHIVLSRATAEGITASFVLLTAMALLIHGLATKKMAWVVAAFPLFLLTYLLYPGFRILTPLVLGSSLWLTQTRRQRMFLIGVTLGAFLLTFTISQTTWGRGRFEQTSVFFHNNTVAQRQESLRLAMGPNHWWEAKIFHNKPVGYIREIWHQYLSYFSPEFLLTRGGLPPRYLVPDQGLIYSSMLFTAGLALSWIIWQRRPYTSAKQLSFSARLQIWFLLLCAFAPLPAALTLDDTPNVHRALPLGIFLCLALAPAISIVLKNKWAKVPLWLPVIFLVAVEFTYFWHQYTSLSNNTTSWYRNDDKRTLVRWMIDESDRNPARHFIVPMYDSLPVYYAFFTENFDAQLATQFSKGLFIDQLGPVQFVTDDCPTNRLSKPPVPPTAVVTKYEQCSKPANYLEIQAIRRFDDGQSYRVLVATSTGVLAPTK
jgi:4-amino-4-deoxy-L-arabinose transferase-like glycosyltransferase